MTQQTETTAELFNVYADYNRHLRMWLILFGVGVPAAIIANDKLLDVVATSSGGFSMALCFIIGSSLQVVIGVINKYVNWYNYKYTKDPVEEEKQNCVYKALHDKIWIDFWFDISSIIILVIGTALLFEIGFSGLSARATISG